MMAVIKFERTWAMPSPDTFDVKPIGAFVHRYLSNSARSVDPFSRNRRWATHTNDLNPSTLAECHMDAEEFLKTIDPATCDLALFDPPYSPRQISECYKAIGLEVGMKETQNAALYARVRSALIPARTDSKMWRRYVMAASEVRFVRGRLVFIGAKYNAPFPSAVVIFRPTAFKTLDEPQPFFSTA